MNREYHKWFSPALRRDMEMLVFGHAGRAVLFFPTRMARFFDYENWGLVEALNDRISNGELQLFCVDSIDAESFYCQDIPPSDRIKRHLEYERYILDEVIPLMQQENHGGDFGVAGCSMGAFHALNLSLKHSQFFRKAVCMSGRYDLTRNIDEFRDLFDGYHNEDIYFNTPVQFISNMYDESLLDTIRRIEFIFAIGETDPFLANNYEMSNLLWGKGIPNHLYVWEGYAHRPRYWREMVKLYF